MVSGPFSKGGVCYLLGYYVLLLLQDKTYACNVDGSVSEKQNINKFPHYADHIQGSRLIYIHVHCTVIYRANIPDTPYFLI